MMYNMIVVEIINSLANNLQFVLMHCHRIQFPPFRRRIQFSIRNPGTTAPHNRL